MVKHAPVAKAAKPVTHRPTVKRPRPVVRAAVARQNRAPQAKPIALVVVAKPDGGSVADAKKALENARQAVTNARYLVEAASAEVKHAKTELAKAERDLGKHAKKTKRVKQKHPVRKTEAKSSSSDVSVSLESSQVKPGESRTVTKSTSDGLAWSIVTVSRK